jgi:hypothetical protein
MENDEVDSLYSSINATFDEAIKVIRDITVEIPKEEEEE